MERKHSYLAAAGGFALSLAAISSACGGEKPQPKNVHPTSDATSASCRDKNLVIKEAAHAELKTITENRLNETIAYMECSSIDPLMLFAQKLKRLQTDGYLVLQDFPTPWGVEPNEMADVNLYGGFPTPNDSSFRMAVNLNIEGITQADIAIFLYKEALVLETLNEQIKNAPNLSTKIASGESREAIECLAWVKTIKDIGIPLQGQVKFEKIKSAINKYEGNEPDGIIDCVNASDLN